MRQIRFRVWDKTRKEFIHNSHAVSFIGELIWLGSFSGEYETYDNNDFIIMQFTGLKDKHEKYIYEGDIVTRDNKWKKEVKWNDSRAAFNIFEDTYPTLEVLGNVYENPDLLK